MLIKMCRQYLPNVAAVNKNMHQVEKISRELRDIGMSMRLDPIRGLFQKMSRLVWDTAKKLGKQINFKMDGEDTELDRTLIDKLADPLMHMARNAIDHGIEKPADREAAGKPKVGTVQLRAFHAGGSVHIQIVDDGRGLDPQKLLAKAIEKGIAQAGNQYSEQEIFAFIFAPGFSTAAVVTDVSGRGVGMDVVKKNIESMRGRVHIKSVVGQGTVFTIELPLTLAIIDGVEVKVGTESYILPALSIVELMRPERSMLSTTLQEGETFHFRGRYLPIFRLGDLYSVQPKYIDPSEALIIVVESGGEFVALMVDEVLSTQSIVIKRLGDIFPDTLGITGCAILADGNIGLILDSRSLVTLARNSYSRRYYTADPVSTEIVQTEEGTTSLTVH
jgi:two-component system chemotaxis sensor kinase CheA